MRRITVEFPYRLCLTFVFPLVPFVVASCDYRIGAGLEKNMLMRSPHGGEVWALDPDTSKTTKSKVAIILLVAKKFRSFEHQAVVATSALTSGANFDTKEEGDDDDVCLLVRWMRSNARASQVT